MLLNITRVLMLYRLVLKPFRGSFVFKLHIYLLLHFQQEISRVYKMSNRAAAWASFKKCFHQLQIPEFE